MVVKLFDAGAQDNVSFRVASGMAELDAAPQTIEAPSIQLNPEVTQQISGSLAYAEASLKEAGLRPDEFDPDTGQIIGAAFRQGNTIGSALASKSLAEKLFPSLEDKDLSDEELIAKAKADGLTSMLNHFTDVYTEKQYEARKADLSREIEDRKILAASGMTGLTASLAAGILDLPTAIPGGTLLGVGKSAMSTTRAAMLTSVAAGIDATTTEAVLQGTQTLRTGEESAINIGSSVVLGGMLGFSVHAAFGNKIGDHVVSRMDAVRKDGATGFQGARSAGAAQLSIYEKAREEGLDSSGRVFSGGAFGILEKAGKIGQGRVAQALGLGKIVSWVGENLRNPRIDLASGLTREEREFVQAFTFDPSISKKQAAGAADENGGVGFEQPVNVAGEMSKYDGEFAQWVHEAMGSYKANKANYNGVDDFGNRVAIATAAGDYSADPIVAAAAKSARTRVLDPILKAHQANGNMKPEMAPRGAISYFPLVHDADKIRAEREDWLNYHTSAFQRDIDEEVRLAKIEQASQRSDKFDAKVEARNVKAKDVATIRAEQEGNIKAINEQRAAHVEAHEATVASDNLALAGARAEELSNLKVKHEQALKDLKEAQDELLHGSKVGEGDKAERLGSDATPAQKAKLRETYQRDKGKLETKYERDKADVGRRFQAESKKLAVDADRKRKDITKKFDDLAEKARVERDKALARAEAEAEAIRNGPLARIDKKDELRVIDTEFKDKLAKLREDRAKAFVALSKQDDAGRKKFKANTDERAQHDARIANEHQTIRDDFDALEKANTAAKKAAIADVDQRVKKRQAEIANAERQRQSLSPLRFNTPEKVLQEATKRANNYYNSVTGSNRFMMDHEVSSSTSAYSKFRSSPAWHGELMRRGWAKSNAFDILEHYKRNAGVDAAVGSVFKKKIVKTDENGQTVRDAKGQAELIDVGDVGLTKVTADIRTRYDEMVNSLRSADEARIAAIEKSNTDPVKREAALVEFKKAQGKEEARLINARDRALDNISMLHRFAKGQDKEGSLSSEGWRNTAEVLGAFNFLRLMGGTVASSLGDPMNLVIAHGFGRTMKYGIVPMLKNFGAAMKNADGDMRRMARLTGANVEAVLAQRVFSMAELGNPYASADPMVSFMRNATRNFSKVTGIQFWNSFWKQVAFNTTHGRIVQNAVGGWGSLSKAERTYMLNLGINEQGLGKIKAAFEGQEGGVRYVDGTDLPIAAFDTWADKEAGSLIRAAANAESHNGVVTPHFSDRLSMAGNPLGRQILQFRNFMFANQMRVVGRNIQLAAVDDAGTKRLGVYTGFFGLAMMGALVDATKHSLGNTTITGGSLDPDHNSFERIVREWEHTPGAALYNALDRSSIFGVIGETSNMAEKLGLPNIRGGLGLAMGDDPGVGRGTARFASRGVFESVFGPTAGLAEDIKGTAAMVSGLGDEWLGGSEGGNFNRSDFRRAKRLLPGSNAPVIQQMINEGEADLGTIFDWPAPR